MQLPFVDRKQEDPLDFFLAGMAIESNFKSKQAIFRISLIEGVKLLEMGL